MNNILKIAELTEKKVWSEPIFEIISKDIVKGGVAAGTEGTGNQS